MRLTDVAIRKAKPRDRHYKMFDSGGLYLFISPSGSRLWRMKYRYHGKEKLLSFGPYPLISLRDAREKRDGARRLLVDDIDPSIAHKEKQARQKAEAEARLPFGLIAQEYYTKLVMEEKSPATLKKLRWLLEKMKPSLYDRPIREIDARELWNFLRKFEAEGKFETAQRLRGTIGSIMRFGVATGRTKEDPTTFLKGALVQHRAKPHAALLDFDSVGKLLLSVMRTGGHQSTRLNIVLLAHLACRPGELRQAKWSEFDFEEKHWRIPAERLKMRRPHRSPLSSVVVRYLFELREMTGYSEFLFPSVRTPKKPMSNGTINGMLRRANCSLEPVTAHGFRSTFSTLANESSLWHPDAIDRAIAHVEENKSRRAYVRGEHWLERVRMSEWYSERLERSMERARKALSHRQPQKRKFR